MIETALYESNFHDGSIIDIQHKVNEILISMESAEISDTELESIKLSDRNRLKGILHLKGIKSIFLNEKLFLEKLHLWADSAGILNLQISEGKIRLFVEWTNFPPKKSILPDAKYSDIVIECEKIHWENVPDLYDPFG